MNVSRGRLPKVKSLVPLWLVILGGVLAAFIVFPVEVAHALSAPTNQTAGAAMGTAQHPTVTYGSSVSAGQMMVCSIGMESSARSVSSITDTGSASDVWAQVTGASITGGSTTTMKLVVWAAIAQATATPTVTINFDTTTIQSWITCWVAPDAIMAIGISVQTATGTFTAGTTANMLFTSFNPQSPDLLYVVGLYQPCGTESSITYSSGFTSMTARSGTPFSGATNCQTVGSIKGGLNMADEYRLTSNSGTTAQIQDTFGTTVNTGTWGWIELAIDFEPACATSSVTPCNISLGSTDSSGSATTTCTLLAPVTAGHMAAVGIGVLPSSVTISSVAATGNGVNTLTWAQVTGATKTGGSTVTIAAYIWAAQISTSSTGPVTLTVTMSGTITDVKVNCFEVPYAAFVTGATTQTGSGTATSGTSYSTSTGSLTSVTSDLAYSLTFFQPCGTGTSSGAPTAGWTIMYAYQAGEFTGATNCQTTGSVKYRFDANDQYKVGDNTGSTAATTPSWTTAINTGTWGWVEIQVDFKKLVSQAVKYTLFTPTNGVNQGITITAGCGAIPVSVTGDGSAHTITAAHDCSVTFNLPNGATANDRYAWSNGLTTHTITSCSSGTCTEDDATYYYQFKGRIYFPPANNGILYDGVYTFHGIATQFGTAATNICGVTTANNGGTVTCNPWLDSDNALTATASVADGANGQWAENSQTMTPTSANFSMTFQYYRQLTNYGVEVDAAAGQTFNAGDKMNITTSVYGVKKVLVTLNPSGGSTSVSASGLTFDYNAPLDCSASIAGSNYIRDCKAHITPPQTSGGITYTFTASQYLSTTSVSTTTTTSSTTSTTTSTTVSSTTSTSTTTASFTTTSSVTVTSTTTSTTGSPTTITNTATETDSCGSTTTTVTQGNSTTTTTFCTLGSIGQFEFLLWIVVIAIIFCVIAWGYATKWRFR